MSDRKPPTIGLAIAMPVIAAFFVAFRFQARMITKQKFLSDDWLVLGALVFCIGLSASALGAVFLGNLGGHLNLGPGNQAQNPDSYVALGKAFWAMQLLSVPAVGLAKLSVLFFFRRIFFVSPVLRVVSWAMVALVIAWNITFFFFNMLDCLPIDINWRTTAGASGKCVSIVYIYWSQSLSDIFTDVMILLLPWPQIWKMRLSKAQKLQVSVVFILGYFVVGAGIARMVLSSRSIFSKTRDLDYTYSRAPTVQWLIIEADIGVISACLPVLRPIVASTRLSGVGSLIFKALGRDRSGYPASPESQTQSVSSDTRPVYERKTEKIFPGFHVPDQLAGVEEHQDIQSTDSNVDLEKANTKTSASNAKFTVA
ncbi:hypothetical protein GQ53DRAFT_831832 [Thozetella sp. PMI_491]|nr:hypothetical protein GQ53DRAFT_831832 [Thozetella sp. PMI_491]